MTRWLFVAGGVLVFSMLVVFIGRFLGLNTDAPWEAEWERIRRDRALWVADGVDWDAVVAHLIEGEQS